MDGQITLTEAMSSVTYDRYGRPYQTPEWMDRDRCELCRHWTRLPEEDQPPAGWGVKGQCDVIFDTKQSGYFKMSKTSYCGRYDGLFE